MSLGLKAKIALSIGSLSAIGAGGAFASNMLAGDTVEDHLKKSGFTIIEDKDHQWATVIIDYRKAINTKTELKFKDFLGEAGNEDVLKKHCKELLNQKYKATDNNIDYKKTVWCIKEQSVSDYLKLKGKRVLNIATSGANADNQKWDTKTIAYSRLGENDASRKIASISLSKSNLDSVNDEDRNKVKNACKTLNEKKHYEDEFEKFKKLAEEWCSELILKK